MRYPQLDQRLSEAAGLFTACALGADIGADHGRLSCALLQSGRCARMIISDKSAQSLAKAERLLTLHAMRERAEFRVADGLDALRGDAPQCVAICGMGGRLMARILLRGAGQLRGAALVLSSHTDIPLLREAVMQIGYHIARERVAQSGGRFYILLRAEPGDVAYTPRQLYIGPALMAQRPPGYLPYLAWRRGVVACQRGRELQLRWIEEEISRETGDST